ncbi:MAG TPA: hypothetical protein VN081_02765 [Dongiaceae bacterium]|nr:hypothetical protein [Dongiaceae bacterium]
MAEKGFLDDVFDKIGSYENNSGFTRGTHPVKILLAEDETDAKDRSIIKLSVEGANGELGEATLWFHSEGGAKMAVTKIAGALVHNASEDRKDSIRESVKKLLTKASEMGDLELTKKVILKLIAEKLIGKEGFAVADPQGKYSTTKYVDFWHYEFQLDDDEAPKSDVDKVADAMGGGEEVAVPEDDDDIEIPDDL